MIFYVIENFSAKEARAQRIRSVSKVNWRSKWALRDVAKVGTDHSGASKEHKKWIRGHRKKLRKSHDIAKKFTARYYQKHKEMP